MNKKINTLMKNTFMLYILTFSNYFFGFITIPYQTRILGPEIYGIIGFATAFSLYLQQFFDYGFILSATEDISKYRDDKNKVKNIFSSVTYCKVILGIIGLTVVLALILFVPIFKSNAYIFILYFIYVYINSLIPDYLYRGLEMMSIITIRTVVIKAVSTLLVFIFMTSSDKYYVVPLSLLCGAICSVLVIYIHLYKKMDIRLDKVKFNEILYQMKRSSVYFFSRVATTVYTVSNTIILGFIYPFGKTVGYYSSSEKIISLGKTAIGPISDSLYPYMVKNKNYKLIRKIMKILYPFIVICCLIGFIFAKGICIFVFGKEYADAANILRCMIPLIILALPSYIFGFPVLSAMGKAKVVNISTIIGAIFQICGLILLAFMKTINVYSICILTNITEFIVCMIRVICVFVNRKLFYAE